MVLAYANAQVTFLVAKWQRMALKQVQTLTKRTLQSPARMQENQGFMSRETWIRTIGTLAGSSVFETGSVVP